MLQAEADSASKDTDDLESRLKILLDYQQRSPKERLLTKEDGMALLEKTGTTEALIYCKYHVPQLETPRSDESDHGRIIGANEESIELASTQIRSHFPSVVGPGSRKDRKACKRGRSQAHHKRKERHTTSYRNRQPMRAQTRVTRK